MLRRPMSARTPKITAARPARRSRPADGGPPEGIPDGALLDRLRTLRQIVAAMATDLAIARRDAARLRRENDDLRRRLAALELADPPAPAAAALGQRAIL
jgi:hypothetical protein